LEGAGVRVDASRSLNRIRVNGQDHECVMFADAGSFVVGQTTVQMRPVSPTEDTTLQLTQRPPLLTLRRSTRELVAPDGTLIAQLSASEELALYEIAIRYPDAADHDSIGQSIWGQDAYDRYLIHRLVQRLREKLGDSADLIENVRGAGYRLRAPLELR
jgi:DNA-binding response OmpR family regulator